MSHNRKAVLACALVLSTAHTLAEHESSLQNKHNNILASKPDDERAKQKAMLMLLGAGTLAGISRVIQNSSTGSTIGNFVNLSAGEFQASCGLAAALSAIGLFAREDIAKTFRSMAWRVPVMAAVGGIVSHQKVNDGLSYTPLGIGDWFKNNPADNKKGIFAIYAIGAWYLLKPSLDRIESFVSKKVTNICNYVAGDETHS